MKFVVGRADEIPPGGRKIVRVAGRSIGVFNVRGQFYALRNRCPHQGAPLCEGKLWGSLTADVPGAITWEDGKDIIACISHGWEFSLKTGQSWCDPQRLRVRSYEVTVEDRASVACDLPMTEPAEAVATSATPADPEAPVAGMVKGPYTVKTYPVTMEAGYLYLVVDLVDVAAPQGRQPASTELSPRT